MAVTLTQIRDRVMKETGYNRQVVAAVMRSMLKQTLWALIKDADHKVSFQNAFHLEMKAAYRPGTVRKGLNLEVSEYARKLCASFTSNIKRKVNKQGIEQTILDIWGEQNERKR